MLTKNTIFYHYGASHLDKNKIFLLERKDSKPRGGLWGSDKHQWKDWCESEKFKVSNLKTYFKFKLKDSARVLIISSNKDWKKLRKRFSEATQELFKGYFVYDWKIIAKYFDALIVNMDRDILNRDIGFELFDVDSICVFNKDAVKEVI